MQITFSFETKRGLYGPFLPTAPRQYKGVTRNLFRLYS